MPLLYAVCLLILGGASWRLLGPLPTAGLIAAVLALPQSRTVWQAAYYDHHGPVALCLTAGILLVAIGAMRDLGERSAKRCMVAAGVLLGTAIWISAATAIPAIAAVFVGMAAALCLTDDAAAWGRLCRRMGRALAVTSVLFYLLEYFPWRMGLRLEVNHPLYALACAAAGELVYRLGLQREVRAWRPTGGAALIILACLALVALPAVVAFGAPAHSFWVADPFLLGFHQLCIMEFQPMLGSLLHPDFSRLTLASGILLGLAVACPAIALIQGYLQPRSRAALAVTIPPVVAFLLLALWQIRWSNDLAASLAAMLAVMLYLTAGAKRRWLSGSVAALAFLPLLADLPQLARELGGRQLSLSRTDVIQLQMRQTAQALKTASAPEEKMLVLSGPTASALMMYFGDLPVLGTLYWENLPGLHRTADLYGCSDQRDLAAGLEREGVTHVVVVPWESMLYTSLVGKSEQASVIKRLTERGVADGVGLLEVQQERPAILQELDESCVVFRRPRSRGGRSWPAGRP
jgi:hypothetical protein